MPETTDSLQSRLQCPECHGAIQAETFRILRFCSGCGRNAMGGRDYAIFAGSLFVIAFTTFYLIFDLTRDAGLSKAPGQQASTGTGVGRESPDPSGGEVGVTLPSLPAVTAGAESSGERRSPESPPGSGTTTTATGSAEPVSSDPPAYAEELASFEKQWGREVQKSLGDLVLVHETIAPRQRIELLASAVATLESSRRLIDALDDYVLSADTVAKLAEAKAKIDDELAWSRPALAQLRTNPLGDADVLAAEARAESLGRELEFWEALATEADFADFRAEILGRKERVRDEIAELWKQTIDAVAAHTASGNHAKAIELLEAFADLGVAAYQNDIAVQLARLREQAVGRSEQLAKSLEDRVTKWLFERKNLKCARCGGDGSRKCATCRGTGREVVLVFNGSNRTQDCKKCGADGRVECADCVAGASKERGEELRTGYRSLDAMLKIYKKGSIEVQVADDLRQAFVRCLVKYGDEPEYIEEVTSWVLDVPSSTWYRAGS